MEPPPPHCVSPPQLNCCFELARRPNAGISYAGLHTACLTASVDFDRPVKLLLVRAQEFLLPFIAVRAPRRSSRPANVTRLLPTQGSHIASPTAAVEIDRPVADVLTRRHEEEHTQHMPSGRALRDVQSHRGSRTNGGGNVKVRRQVSRRSLGYNSRNNPRMSSLWGGDTGLYRRTISLLQLSLRQLRYTEERPDSQLSLR